MKSDSQLQQDLSEELNWDASIDASRVTIAVKQGLVTLGGQVSSYAEKWEAEQAVQRVTGVRAVVVGITVAPFGSHTDADVARAAESVLASTSYLPRDSVRIQVENGWITLSGKVDWDYQRQNAESAVRVLAGVKGITNEVTLDAELPFPDIKAGIQASLGRQFDSDDEDISVSVSGRNVTLSGTVSGIWQKDLACNAAWNAPGVRNVTDNLTINY